MDPMNAPVLEWYRESDLPGLPGNCAPLSSLSAAPYRVSAANDFLVYGFSTSPPTVAFPDIFHSYFEPTGAPQPNDQVRSWPLNLSICPPASPVESTWSNSSAGSSHSGMSPVLGDRSMDLPVPPDATTGGQGLPYSIQPSIDRRAPQESVDGGWPSVISNALASLSLQPTLKDLGQEAYSVNTTSSPCTDLGLASWEHSASSGPYRQSSSKTRKSRQMNPLNRPPKVNTANQTNKRSGSGALGLCQWRGNFINGTQECGVFLNDMTNGEFLNHLKHFHGEVNPGERGYIACRWRGCRATRATNGLYQGGCFKKHVMTLHHVRVLNPA